MGGQGLVDKKVRLQRKKSDDVKLHDLGCQFWPQRRKITWPVIEQFHGLYVMWLRIVETICRPHSYLAIIKKKKKNKAGLSCLIPLVDFFNHIHILSFHNLLNKLFSVFSNFVRIRCKGLFEIFLDFQQYFLELLQSFVLKDLLKDSPEYLWFSLSKLFLIFNPLTINEVKSLIFHYLQNIAKH